MSGWLRKTQRDLYLAQRTAGDLNALQRGGTPRLARRVLKRAYHRKVISLLRRGGVW